MSTLHRTGPATSVDADPDAARAARQAFVVLRTAFTVAPLAFGLDKLVNLLTDWPKYLAPWIDHLVPGSAQQAGAVALARLATAFPAPVLRRGGARG